MERSKPYTAAELFEKIMNQVGTPDWVDYAIACNHSYDEASRLLLKYDEFDIFTTTEYGGSEGVYTDIYIKGNYKGPNEDYDRTPISIGTVKTLEEGPEAVRKMYGLAADIYIAAVDFVHKNMDDFIWHGYKVTLKPGDRVSLFFGSEETMARRIEKMAANGEDVSQAVITDMVTRRTVDPAKYIPVDNEPDEEPDI